MFLLILIASQGAITPCLAAGLVIEALNFSVLPGSSGSFDVLLVNTNASGGTSYDVAADSLDISLSGPTGFAITDVNMSTSNNYIFAESIDANFGLPLATIASPTSFTSNDAGDVVNGYPGYQVVNPGQTYGLAHVDYTTSTTASGLVTIAFNNIGVGTSLSDPNGNPLPFTTLNSVVPRALGADPGCHGCVDRPRGAGMAPAYGRLVNAAVGVVAIGVPPRCRRGELAPADSNSEPTRRSILTTTHEWAGRDRNPPRSISVGFFFRRSHRNLGSPIPRKRAMR